MGRLRKSRLLIFLIPEEFPIYLLLDRKLVVPEKERLQSATEVETNLDHWSTQRTYNLQSQPVTNFRSRISQNIAFVDQAVSFEG